MKRLYACWQTVLTRTVLLSASALQHRNYAAAAAPIIHPPLAAYVSRQERLDVRPSFVGQSKQIGFRDYLLPIQRAENRHQTDSAIDPLGLDPMYCVAASTCRDSAKHCNGRTRPVSVLLPCCRAALPPRNAMHAGPLIRSILRVTEAKLPQGLLQLDPAAAPSGHDSCSRGAPPLASGHIWGNTHDQGGFLASR